MGRVVSGHGAKARMLLMYVACSDWTNLGGLDHDFLLP